MVFHNWEEIVLPSQIARVRIVLIVYVRCALFRWAGDVLLIGNVLDGRVISVMYKVDNVELKRGIIVLVCFILWDDDSW